MRVRRQTCVILWHEDIPVASAKACLYPTIQSCLDAYPSCSLVISVPPPLEDLVRSATEFFPDRSVPCRVVPATYWDETLKGIDDDSELIVAFAGTSFKLNNHNFDLLVRRGPAVGAAFLIDDVCNHAEPDAEVTVDGHGWFVVDPDSWDAPRRTRHKASGVIWFRTAHDFKVARAHADRAADAGRESARKVTATLNYALPVVGYYLDSAYDHIHRRPQAKQ